MTGEHLTEDEVQAILELETSGSLQLSTAEVSMIAHSRECPACATLTGKWRAAEGMIKTLRYLPSAKNGDPCPDEGIWEELVAGVVKKKEAMRLLEHCSRCAECTVLLKRAQEGLDPETQEESAPERAPAEWQLQMAQRMAAQVAASRSHRQRERKWIWGFVAATAAAAAVIAAIWFIPSRKAPDIERMLADVYSHDRTLVLRMPHASHAPVHALLSGGQESLFARDPLILQSQQAITALCKRQPENAECLLFQAQLNLLAGQYQPASATLAQVKLNAATPGEREKYLLLHATAFFEQAQQSEAGQDLYSQAAKDLSEILRSSPQNAVALFNRAMIYEKLNWTVNAAADWKQFLDVEKDPGWRQEATEHLESLEQKKNPAS